jgi:hypothetical protein
MRTSRRGSSAPTRPPITRRSPGFRARHQDALAQTFTQVLALCARAGLVSVGVVALDGTAMAANASHEATRSYPAIRKEVDRILGWAAEVDAAEDAEHGVARGDELPAELSDRRSRLERLRRCREELEAEQAQVQAAYDDNLAWRAEWEAEHGRRLGGRKPLPPDPDGLAKRSINTTDPDSRKIVRTGKTAVQGYNAQAVATAGQIIVAADITQQSNDAGQLEPMIGAALAELAQAGIDSSSRRCWPTAATGTPRTSLRSATRACRYSFRPKARSAPRPGRCHPANGPEARRIDKVLDTRDGQALYRRRQHIIETVFARTEFLRGITRFQRRGLDACRAEWQLIATGHSLLKLHTALTH